MEKRKVSTFLANEEKKRLLKSGKDTVLSPFHQNTAAFFKNALAFLKNSVVFFLKTVIFFKKTVKSSALQIVDDQ